MGSLPIELSPGPLPDDGGLSQNTKKASLGRSSNCVAILHEGVGPGGGQDESEYALRVAPKAKAEASPQWQKPCNGAARVGTVTPAVGRWLPVTFGVKGAAIRGKQLLPVRESPASQGEAQGMGRGIRKGDAQRQWHQSPCDWCQRLYSI